MMRAKYNLQYRLHNRKVNVSGGKHDFAMAENCCYTLGRRSLSLALGWPLDKSVFDGKFRL